MGWIDVLGATVFAVWGLVETVGFGLRMYGRAYR